MHETVAITGDNRQHNGQTPADYDFYVILNRSSGAGDPNELVQRMRDHHPELRVTEFKVICRDDDLEQVMADRFRRAREEGRAVLVGGGDGTINLAVKNALKYQVPLALLAQGTFNLFARHHGLSEDLREQLQQLSRCKLQQVAVCFINGMPFTASANFGIYPAVIRDRERYMDSVGTRNRVLASLAGLISFFKYWRRIRLLVRAGDRSFRVRALMVMVTQNRPQLRQFGFEQSAQHIDGRLALIVVKPLRWLDKLRLLLKGSFGRLKRDRDVQMRLYHQLTLHSSSDTVNCALDGELMSIRSPITLEAKANALPVFIPRG